MVAPPTGFDRVPGEAAGAVPVDGFVRSLLADGVPTKTIARALASIPGTTKKAAYARVLEIAGEQ